MAILVGPNLGKPTHDIKLSKGGTELGLILCDQQGNHITRANREPYPNTAIKMYQGEATHSDREPPFMDLIQEDWSLGRGLEVFEDDKSRYQDGWQADTTRQGKVILGPQSTYSKGVRDWGGYMPGSVVFRGLYGTQRYQQRGWTVPSGGGFAAEKCEILLRKKGSPNSGVTIELRNTTLGTTYKTIAIAAADITDDYLSVWVEGDWATTYTLSASTEYRIVVYATSGSDDIDNCWEVGSEEHSGTSLNSSKSSDGSSWTDTSTQWGIYFRMIDTDSDYIARFIEYRGQLYFATAPYTGSAFKLYMNGARGVADVNTANLNQLRDFDDGTGWATCPGDVVKMINGYSWHIEHQTWRYVDKDLPGGNGYLYIEGYWNEPHDGVWDEYVIVGSDTWVERTQSLATYPAKDIAVANEVMYITQNAGAPMITHREVNDTNGGNFNWVDGTEKMWYDCKMNYDFVEVIQDYISGPVLYFGRNSGFSQDDAEILREVAPNTWQESPIGALYLVDSTTGWDEQVIGNVTSTYVNKIAKVAVGEPFTTGVIASKAISSVDIRFGVYLIISVKSSIDLAAGVLELVFDNTANCASPVYAIPFPALKSGNWAYPLFLDVDTADIADTDSIISVGLRITQDVAEAFDIETNRGVMILTKGGYEPILIPDARITGLERYGEPETCWVLCEHQIGEIRNNFYQPVPIREMEAVESDENGLAHCVHDVYMYFSLKDGVEKYYRQHLDDMGPNRDMGLPVGRHGSVAALVGYPGRIYAAIDGGDSGYSSVLCYNKGGWHEIYRSRIAGRRIKNLYIQSVPGYIHSRLWISEGSDILWIPIGLNPLRDPNFRFVHEGAVVTSRIHGGLQDVAKFFKSVKLATRELTTGIEIYVDYRTDEDTTWTRIGNVFDTSPYQEEDLSASQDVSGRWIEMRAVLRTDDNTTTPELLAWVIKAIEREEGKYANTYTFRVKDWDRDLQGDPQDYRVDDFMDDLETMINDPLPVLVNSVSDLDDNKYVVTQPTSLKRIRVIPEEDGNELHICQITLLEI